MNKAINIITDQLNNVFSEMDSRVLEQSKIWAIERRDALYNFIESDEAISMSYDDRYDEAVLIAGGKTWYDKLNGRDDDYVLDFVEKNCKSISDKRNQSIVKKLIKADVTKVIEAITTKTTDGFNGTFVINTNNGTKKVTIETIYAGGYNIQCFHLRVLVKIK